MIAYLAIVGEIGAPPNPAWRCVYSGQRVRVFLRAGAKDPLAGYRLQAGYCIGRTADAAIAAQDLTSTWGAFVSITEDEGSVAVQRDPSGRIPAFVARTEGGYVVASHLDDLLTAAPSARRIDWDYVAFTMVGGHLPAARTGMREVREILPGEQVRLETASPVSKLIWRPADFYERPYASLPQARQAIREACELAAGFWAEAYQNVTLDLSGGLDSASMLGLLATSRASPQITCVNRRTAHAESDERPYARAAAHLHQLELIETSTDAGADGFALGPRGALQPRPTHDLLLGSFETAAAACAGAAGAQAFFTGRGGDHLFFSGVPALAAADHLRRLGHPLALPKVAYELAQASGCSIWRVLRQSCKRSLPAERLAGLLTPNPFLSEETVAGLDLSRFPHPWLQSAAQGAPPAKFAQIVNLVELQRHYSRTGRAERIDETHPFISQPVIEACLSTPAEMFVAGGWERGLQRQVFADLIPQEIMTRRSKGATSSHVLRTISHHLAQLRPLLLEGELSGRGMLDRARVEASLDRLALKDGRFVGRLLYVITAELWVRRAQEAINRRMDEPRV